MTWLQHGWHVFSGNIVHGLALAAVVLCLVYAIERMTGERTSQYRTPNFRTDLVYWVYYMSGLNEFMVNLILFAWFSQKLSFLSLHLDRYLHPVARYAVYWLVVDFSGYWVHRMFHENKVLWPFHMAHHSQEILTFATSTRFHPVESGIAYSIKFIPMFMMGPPPVTWLWFNFALRQFPDLIQHSEIAWKMGPFYRLFVSPTFHSFHHAIDPRYYNRNYGVELSIWDFLFGTAVDEDRRPREYGLASVRWPTFREQLLNPFVLSWRLIFPVAEKSKSAAG